MRATAQAFLRLAFDINRHLSRFFPDPVAFRSLQARTATLISGSNALQFLDRALWPEADLDIYVFKQHVGEIGRFLLGIGYNFQPAEGRQDRDFEIASANISVVRQDEYPGPIYDIFEFTKGRRGEDDHRKIEIVAAVAPFLCVLRSHSSESPVILSY